MALGKPMLYASLPGVAFILGLLWFRHRNKRGDSNKKRSVHSLEVVCSNTEYSNKSIEIERMLSETQKSNDISVATSISPSPSIPFKQSRSMIINEEEAKSIQENTVNQLFGKSAPINIIQNGRIPSTLKEIHHIQMLDCEVLKSKIQDAGQRVLGSIEEDTESLSSPIDLPDSISNRMQHCMRKNEKMVSIEKGNPYWTREVDANSPIKTPVVVTASVTPKISPEHSFVNNNYVQESKQESNVESLEETSPSKTDNNKVDTTTNNDAVNEERTSTIENITDNSDLNDEKRNTDVASPALSLCSAQSGDSGKGCSLPPSEPTRTKNTYEFFFPCSLIGHLYGRNRSFINLIKSKTNANIMLKNGGGASKVRICMIEGTQSEIQAALDMIRQRLPVKRYPNLTMQRIYYARPQSIVPLPTENMINLQLNLIEGINNDVVVSSIISGGHLFVQHPLHPTHPSLAVLQRCMYDMYNTIDAPLLPHIELSAVCVLPVNGFWYRVQIIQEDSENKGFCIIKFLDFGGYKNVHINELRQIRSDLMAVPFQATECVLSNIEPIESTWKPEDIDVLHNLTNGIVLQAQVAGYNSLNVPEIFLYANVGHKQIIFINKELVARGLAKWVDV